MTKSRNTKSTASKAVVPAKKSQAAKVQAPPTQLVAYKAALSRPFSLAAQGARVPDMYSVATTTRHITRKLTLSSNASGECDLVVIPSAYLHAMSPRASIVGGDSWITLNGATLANAAVQTLPSALAGQLTNYRVVGYGVKIIGIAAMTTNAGSLTLATVPAEGYVNLTSTIGNQAANSNNAFHTVANTLTAYGVPNSSNVVSVASLPSLPNSVESSLINVSERPITITPKVCSPNAFIFKNTSDIGPGFSAQNQTSAVSISVGNASYLQFGGHESVVIAATGCPASTSMLDIEITYHLEGNPFISATAGSIIGSDSSSVAVDPLGFMNVIREVAAMPTFKALAIGVGDSFFPGLGTMVGKLF